MFICLKKNKFSKRIFNEKTVKGFDLGCQGGEGDLWGIKRGRVYCCSSAKPMIVHSLNPV